MDGSEPRSNSWVLRAGILAWLALALGCGGDANVEPVELRVPVAVSEVATGSVEDVIVTTGTLRAANAVQLTVETPGYLRLGQNEDGRRLGEGDRVEAGQVLASVSGEPARLAAGLVARRQRFEVAEERLRSRRQLFESGLISAEELREAEAAVAEARLDLDRGLVTRERSSLVTPISGVVLRLARNAVGEPVADGQLVAPGFEIARVAPLHPLIAEVDLVGPDAARVEVGMSARVRHHALEGVVFVGELIRLSPMVDPRTRAFHAEVEVDNAGGRQRPGMFVEVTLLVERRDDVVVAPRNAVTERGGAEVVFVVDGQRVVERRVSLGFGDGERVEIRTGLVPGERLVTRGLETLTDGTRVRVTEN